MFCQTASCTTDESFSQPAVVSREVSRTDGCRAAYTHDGTCTCVGNTCKHKSSHDLLTSMGQMQRRHLTHPLPRCHASPMPRHATMCMHACRGAGSSHCSTHLPFFPPYSHYMVQFVLVLEAVTKQAQHCKGQGFLHFFCCTSHPSHDAAMPSRPSAIGQGLPYRTS